MNDFLSKIKNFEAFQNVEDEALEWLIEKCEYRVVEEGEILINTGEPIEYMNIVVDGEIVFYFPQGNKLKEFGVAKSGDVTGILPFSRLDKTKGVAKSTTTSHLLLCHKKHFPDLVCQSYQLAQNLVAIMSTRIRDFTHRGTQTEKLTALGKLSAGLAHELNNPASAMVRSAQKLRQNIHSTPDKFKQVITMRVSEEQTDQINGILFGKIKNRPEDDNRTLLEKESTRDDLVDWLEDNDIPNADEIAETYLEYWFTEDDLDEIHSIIGTDHLFGVLAWIANTLSNENLISEIQESAQRIAELVGSMKSYSRMDQDSDVEYTDIHKGIINTVIILKHKIKAKQIELVKELDKSLPNVKVHPGQINQIWTNLIDNALDAMDKGGQLKIRTFKERNFFCVTVEDNGKGIPQDVINRIFEPFFTTKGIGEGTGMGLDIVLRIINNHKGTINVESEPGKTIFKVCLPM